MKYLAEKDQSFNSLPKHLKKIKSVLLDPGVEKTRVGSRVLERLPGLRVLDSSSPEAFADRENSDEQVLYLKQYQGRFLRFCPGTKYCNCCGYRIIHIGENCPLNCSYCILKSYFQDQVLKVWANQKDLFKELEQRIGSRPDKLFRMGTGEFTDSLALEPLTGYSTDLIEFLSQFPNACLELKSKVVDLSWMRAVKDPKQVLPAWSLNSLKIAEKEELGAASLEDRLKAAKVCADNGFRVCLHFDPIIEYPGWEKGYSEIVEMIFDYLRFDQIAYLSLGSFRCMPELKEHIARHWPESKYIYTEMLTGLDGKLRLLRPRRVRQFRLVAEKLKSFGLDKEIYFCMESDEVWQAVLGRTPRQMGGLDQHLLGLVF